MEKKLMRLSLVMNAVLAFSGLYFGYKAHSSAILTDGMYSSLLAVMSFLSMGVLRLIRKPQSKTHPFGYSGYEPLVNLFRGLMILMVVVFGTFESIDSLMHGGNIIDFSSSLIYFVLCLSGCIITYFIFYFQNRKQSSPILKVEKSNWLIDTLLTAGMGISFMVAFFLKNFFPEFIAYVDPLVTILLLLSIVKMPFDTIRGALKELLQMAPSEDITHTINRVLKQYYTPSEISDYNHMITKTGREIYVLAVVLLNESQEKVDGQLRFDTIEKHDVFRETLFNDLKSIYPTIRLDVSFTFDAKWL
ncbi:cation diffusion facilitator family transporter [Flammeovirga agarivorans]|uniref:Cation diffusion facilitator family transporter n=1 Tax=Flammeovirga agarivorans TaxID=2726742 RepID=A0A7X8XVE3_9BACT|nr:cation diffusion facilitator family transporter [Flammeovirga agarivorans]NLR90980.1 cation diffusion facilitator family transporter [Flammeovirga agarivorans]